jgi:acetyltransferase
MIELINDRAMELPPLNQFLARRLIERARVAETLGEWRGAPAADHEALERVLLRVSEMVCELPQLREMDINPLIVDEHGALAVDARIVIRRRSRHQPLTRLRPPGHPALPGRYEQIWPLAAAARYWCARCSRTTRRCCRTWCAASSPSRYFRFASAIAELPPGLLARSR